MINPFKNYQTRKQLKARIKELENDLYCVRKSYGEVILRTDEYNCVTLNSQVGIIKHPIYNELSYDRAKEEMCYEFARMLISENLIECHIEQILGNDFLKGTLKVLKKRYYESIYDNEKK